MTATGTRTASFTITDARYVGAKIGADLRLLSNLYGRPALASIDNFAEEAALLLRDGYLGTVDYGFLDSATNAWKLRLRYTATAGGQLMDSRPGTLPTAAAVAGRVPQLSHLLRRLRPADAGGQASVRATLPVTRVGAPEPTTGPETSWPATDTAATAHAGQPQHLPL